MSSIAGVVITNVLIHGKYRVTYESIYDTFRIEFLLIPAFAMALILHVESTGPKLVDVLLSVQAMKARNLYCIQILWTFSVYLESVALLPQIYLIARTNNIENLTKHYIFTIGLSRFLEMIFWLYIAYKTLDVMSWIPTYMAAASLVIGISNALHTIVLSDFLVKYIQRWDRYFPPRYHTYLYFF